MENSGNHTAVDGKSTENRSASTKTSFEFHQGAPVGRGWRAKPRKNRPSCDPRVTYRLGLKSYKHCVQTIMLGLNMCKYGSKNS